MQLPTFFLLQTTCMNKSVYDWGFFLRIDSWKLSYWVKGIKIIFKAYVSIANFQVVLFKMVSSFTPYELWSVRRRRRAKHASLVVWISPPSRKGDTDSYGSAQGTGIGKIFITLGTLYTIIAKGSSFEKFAATDTNVYQWSKIMLAKAFGWKGSDCSDIADGLRPIVTAF